MSFRPDESSQALYDERTWLQGAILASVAYGVVLALFFLCFDPLLHSARTKKDRKSIGLLVYVCIVFMFATFFVGASAKVTQNSFIDDRNFPGGPGAYENQMFWIPISEFGNACYNITNWAADGLLVWRCFIIYRGCRVPAWMYMLLPCMLLIVSFVLGTLYLIQVGSPLGSPWANNPINYTLLYASTSLTLNMFTTCMIVGRLLVYRRRLVKVLGSEHGRTYLTVTSMLIESAALYAVMSLLFLIPFGFKNPLANIMLQATAEIQVIASLLIIYRVAQGKAWTKDTVSTIMTQKKTHDAPVMKISRIQFVAAGNGSGDSSNTAIVNPEEKDGKNDSTSTNESRSVV